MHMLKIYVTSPLANVELNFAESLRCGEPLQCMQETICAWEGLSITAMEPTAFTVKIGLSGGLRGYQAITGNRAMCQIMYEMWVTVIKNTLLLSLDKNLELIIKIGQWASY